MSIRVMTHVWEHSKLTGTPLLLVLALADYANDERQCWPSIKTLAEKARISQRHTQRLLRQLAETGHISIHEAVGPHGCNVYELAATTKMEDLADLEATRGWEEVGDDTSDTPDTSDGGMTLGSPGGDTGVAGGMTLVSPEPSLNRQDPSERRDGVPSQARAAQPVPLLIPAEERRIKAVRTAAREHFERQTGLRVPKRGRRSALGRLWWNPIREICDLAHGDLGAAKALIDRTLERMEGLTIADPNSIIKTARAVAAERERPKVPGGEKGIPYMKAWG